jgi:hypothetical protein
MDIQQLLSEGYTGIFRVLDYTLKGLTLDDVNWQPKPDCNSIGWVVWHMTRLQDREISSFMGEEQLWIKEAWHKKFNHPADPADIGAHMKPEDLPSFKSPDAATLLGYHKAVLARSQKYFTTIKKTDLDKLVEGTPLPKPPTVGALLLIILGDGFQHAGQASYIRGMRQGFGWH